MSDRDGTPIPRLGAVARRLTPALLALATLAGCNGDDTAGATTTDGTVTSDPEASSTDPAPTTAPPTPTSAPSSSTPPETTATTPPPTDAPTTTTHADVEQAVIDAVLRSWAVFNEAKLDPFDDDKVAAIGGVRTGALLERSVEIIGDYRISNRRSVTNATTPARIDPLLTTLVVDLTAGTATVQSCRLDSNAVVEIGAGEDGADLVINDEIVTYRETAELALVDGTWLEEGGAIIEEFEGVSNCEG